MRLAAYRDRQGDEAWRLGRDRALDGKPTTHRPGWEVRRAKLGHTVVYVDPWGSWRPLASPAKTPEQAEAIGERTGLPRAQAKRTL